jgi:antitoxin (DNA-binding transcriptional repressor) of toxin-antitoxin stability system
MSELPLEEVPTAATAVHEAASGRVVWLTEHGERIAAIIPAELAAEIERLGPDEIAELMKDFADAIAARAAHASIAAGEPLIPWKVVKAESGL